MPSSSSSARPPAALWILATAIAALRALPYAWSFVAQPSPGSPPVSAANSTLLHLGYIPKDFLQYVAFAAQAADSGGWLLANPFTTEAQDPRFVAPLLTAIGKLAGAIGASPALVLELVRLPALLLFFAVLWWLLGRFFEDRRTRWGAALLVGLSGGLEVLVKPLGGWLPADVAHQLEQSTWQMSGWTTFAAAFNPLWIVGSTAVLAALALVLDRRRRFGLREGGLLAALVFALYCIHPYSALALLAILGLQPLASALFGEALDRDRSWLRVGLALAPALIAIGALAAWQRGDAVYRGAASEALGAQWLSPFWYPLVFGGLFVLALRGARSWAAGEHPLRFALAAWLAAAVALHTSNLINGYHFVAQLHVPLCILAAPALIATVDRARDGSRAAFTLLAATFAAPLLLTAESLAKLPSTHVVPAEFPAVFAALADRPAGNALVGPRLGNALPAYTPHRVYVGHHFLTPRFRERSEEVRELTTDPSRRDDLVALVERERIRYVVLPTEHAAAGLAALAPRARSAQRIGRFTLLELR
jgi:hypothetical protein